MRISSDSGIWKKEKEKKKIIKTEKFKTLSGHKSAGQELKK